MHVPTVSIVICTRGRADDLSQTLKSIADCTVPVGWTAELVVVDNGSTDHTHEVVAQAPAHDIPVRYVYEEILGLCHARNRGLAESTGSIILFTDDDVRVPVTWLAGMCQPILDGKADAVAGGVTIPAHLKEHLGNWSSWFASTEGIDPIHPQRMVGANMAFRRQVLKKVSCFDVELGSGALGFGEETLFCMQLLAAGYRLVSAFDIRVEHHFNATRLTKKNFRNLAQRMGRSAAYMRYHWDQTPSIIGRREALISWIGLWRRRLSKPIEWLNSSPPPAWELHRLQDLAFYHQYQIERVRKPNYVRGGDLKKIQGS